MASVGIGVIGGRAFIANAAVLPAIDAADGVHLAAIAAHSGPVADRWRSAEVDRYEAVIAHDDVEAVYVPLPNGRHRRWVEAAAAAGKHVLCEKPLAPDAAEARAMVGACDRAGVLLAEAWMTPFAPRWAELVERASDGSIGRVRHIDSSFTFTIAEGNEDNYRWDPAEGGGALLDVGIYALGPAVTMWGHEPDRVDVSAVLADTGVDLTTWGELHWGDDRRATFRVSFAEPEQQTLTVNGATGSLSLAEEAHTGNPGATAMHSVGGDRTDVTHIEGADPYRRMVEAFARAVRGRAPWPRPAEESIAMLALLDRIAEASRRRDSR